MFLLNKWEMQPQLWLLIRKTCYLMEISQENFCIFNRFFPTQNNFTLSCSKLLRQHTISPHKSLQSADPITLLPSVSTQSVHTNPFSQPIPSHCCPPSAHKHTLTALSPTTNMHGLPFSCLHHVTSSPAAQFTYCHHMQRNKRMSGLLISCSVHVLCRQYY